jgi:hypothetical protein
VKSIYNGKTITKNIPNRFYKSFKSLTITIKDTQISITNINKKQIVNNRYLPPAAGVINNGYSHPTTFFSRK